jgi:UDP-N-acetyl-2-amino-2-deoxyglucuronate dehydrogenase
MKRLNIALVGCGRIGMRHAEHIVNWGNLVAACDTKTERAKDISNKYSVPTYDSIESMLNTAKGIDVVSVCSPNGLHAKHTILALKNGCHVLCEKPMAISVEDCGFMIQHAEKANRRLFVIKQNRYNPPVVALKNLLDNNKLGRIYSVQLNCFWNRNHQYYSSSDWKGSKTMDGGTLFTQYSHFIDLLYYLIGDVRYVEAFTDNYDSKRKIEFEDTGVVILRFVNGVIGTINYTVNSYDKNMEGSITIFAEKGTVKIGGEYLNELEYQMIEGERVEMIDKGNPPNNYGTYQGSMSNHGKIYENLVDVLTNGGIISTNGFEGLKTIEIIDKIYLSASKNNVKGGLFSTIAAEQENLLPH